MPQAFGSNDRTISHTAASATGAGSVCDLGNVFSQPIAVVVASAGVSAGVVALEGSLDKINWYAIGTAVTLTTPGTFATAATVPARYLRTNITTIITGGTVTTQVAAGV